MVWRISIRAFGPLSLLLLPALAISQVAPTSPAIAPALVARAQAEGLPLTGFAPVDASATTLAPGDAITVLVTLQERARQRQWLVDFQAEAPRPETTPAPASTTVHLSTGRTYEFSSDIAVLAMRLFGPYGPRERPAAARQESARIFAKTDYLAAGFDRYCALVLRVRDTPQGFPYLVAARPFPAARISREAAVAQAQGLTPGEERAVAATGPALGEFLGIVQSTPVLKQLLVKVADFPSLRGLLFGGQSGFFFEPPGIARLEPAAWGLAPDFPVYRAPFHYLLRGSRVLEGEFIFTAPTPPFLTSAGILAARLTSPKNPQRTLELRLLSARRGSAP